MLCAGMNLANSLTFSFVVLPAEVLVLGGLVGGVVVLASYTVKKTLLNNEAGS
jgi:hypothetical protein